MAVPNVQTKTSIVIEGMRKALGRVPDQESITRAEDEWFDEVKDDIFKRKGWTLLEETKVLITSAYEQRIASPYDFEKMIEVTFYDGGQKGTAQSGTIDSITFSSTEGITEGSAKGSLVFFTDGTGKGEMSRIVSYNESTKIAMISPSVAIAADVTTTYMIATTSRDMHFIPNEPLKNISSTGYPSKISYYEDEFYLYPIPNKSTYAIVLKYLVSIDKVDLLSLRHIKILAKIKNALKAGIYMKTLDSIDDNRYSRAAKEYESIVFRLMVSDSRNKRQRNNSYFKPIGGMPR